MGSEIEEKNALNNLEDAAEAAAVPEEIEHRAKREKDAGAAAAPRFWFIRKKTRLAVAGFVSSSEGRRDRKAGGNTPTKEPDLQNTFHPGTLNKIANFGNSRKSSKAKTR